MDWFERITGFREGPYHETRSKLSVEAGRLLSSINRRSYGVGSFEVLSLGEARSRVQLAQPEFGRARLNIIHGDVRLMHAAKDYRGALFQVASQFNMLEMTGPQVSPEDGVTRYQYDPTQGPACAIAAGAATIYRNYFAPVAGGYGQTAERQLDGLARLGVALSEATGLPVASLWRMQNGYALCERAGLDAISETLAGLDEEQRDTFRSKLRIGLQAGAEVTDVEGEPRPVVSQAFCSALPVSYTRVPSRHWRSFATLVLEAAYEATIWAGVLNARNGGSRTVLLTQVGGGAFGNEQAWILHAMRRALKCARGYDLDVKIVCRGPASQALVDLVESFNAS